MRTTTWRFILMTAMLAVWADQAAVQAPIPGSDKVAARVNGEDIPVAEMLAVLDTRPSPVPVSKELQAEMRKAALDMLVDDLLMRQFLRRAVAPVNPADLQKEFDKLHEALKKQNKTMEQFLQEGKLTPDLLRADIVSRIQWRAYLTSKYPEADIKSYYDANKLLFDNVLVSARHVLVKVAGNASAEDKQKAQAKLQIIRQEIVAGKISFEDAALKYSDCPTKDKGGDLGPFPYKFVAVEPISRAAFSTKKGAMTDIVTTDFGYHILLVTDRTAGEPSVFEQVRDVVRDAMAQEADLYQRILNEQKKSAKIEMLAQ